MKKTQSAPRLRVIAIDGPSGAGKSSVARRVADALRLPYLDTGAMYRSVGLLAGRKGLTVPLPEDFDGAELAGACASLIRLENREGGMRVYLGKEDVSQQIRTPDCSEMASEISTLPAVRRRMVELQRRMGETGGGVMEGRDIGTVVFPDAILKIFLTASPESRALRRLLQRGEDPTPESLDLVLQEQLERDHRDSTRLESPLRRAEDAIHLDTTEMTLDEVVGKIVELFGKVDSGFSAEQSKIKPEKA